jgi:hypothetical protein
VDRRVELWDRAQLDLCGPATLTVTPQSGEIAFGALEVSLGVEYALDSIVGPDPRKADQGEGTAEFLDDGTIEIEFTYHNGDEAHRKSRKDFTATGSLLPSCDIPGHPPLTFSALAI